MLIGERTAEEIKINIGTVYKRQSLVKTDVRGRDLVTGLPRTVSISSNEVMEAMGEPLISIVDAVHSVLEQTPPELASDISDRGIVMTGGGSLIYGMDKLIEHITGINAVIAERAVSCVAIGTGRYVEYLSGKGAELAKQTQKTK